MATTNEKKLIRNLIPAKKLMDWEWISFPYARTKKENKK